MYGACWVTKCRTWSFECDGTARIHGISHLVRIDRNRGRTLHREEGHPDFILRRANLDLPVVCARLETNRVGDELLDDVNPVDPGDLEVEFRQAEDAHCSRKCVPGCRLFRVPARPREDPLKFRGITSYFPSSKYASNFLAIESSQLLSAPELVSGSAWSSVNSAASLTRSRNSAIQRRSTAFGLQSSGAPCTRVSSGTASSCSSCSFSWATASVYREAVFSAA